MDITILEDLGLTESEIKTYLALLEMGSETAGPVRVKSDLQNSVVHRALNSLIEKGLINYVLEGRRRIYQATDPEQFYEFLDEKKRRFTSILPELKEKQQRASTQENATVFKGIRGIKEVYSIMVQQKGEYNTFGGGQPCVERMGMMWWNNLHKRRVANKLASRQVFDETVRPDAGEIESNPLTNVRYLSADFASFQETVIVGDHVAITVFTETPYSLLIKDQLVAKCYRKHFEVLWEQANS